MSSVFTAFLAAAGALVATFLGSGVPGFALASVPSSPTLLVLVRLLTIPSVMVFSVLIGWLLARSRPAASLPAIAAGLSCFVLSQLLPVIEGSDLRDALLSCGAQTLGGLCFAIPALRRSGMYLTSTTGLSYCTLVVALLPLVAWSSVDALKSGSRSAKSGIEVGPLSPSLQTSFVPVAVPLGDKIVSSTRLLGFDEVLTQAVQHGQVSPNPQLQAMRNSVLAGLAGLRAAPCDPAARSRLRSAFLTFLAAMPELAGRPGVELFTASGQTRQITGVLNRPANEAVSEALRAEVIAMIDLPRWAQIIKGEDGTASRPGPGSPLRCR